MPARRYLRIVIGVMLCGVALVAAINFIVDPLQYYRRASWYPPHFSDNQRFQNPGLIRNYDYDTIVLGTSHSENFLASDIARILGRRALKLSISGSSIHEQSLTLRLAQFRSAFA